ncbi:hypothetical protein DFJ74DRAFT_502464 [Hyaloraphidium curvatum]|nr:hypothetical protein DFJ74DRAFT_502464 [Hyaloraphidium curvatum]
MDVDRAASGVLRGLGSWHAWPDQELNGALEALGVAGNIGGRSRFTFRGGAWYLQEGQLRKNDWSSWRIFAVDGRTKNATEVPFTTHGGSVSFANPAACNLPDCRLFCSVFLPGEGAAAGEAGELIYVLDRGWDADSSL